MEGLLMPRDSDAAQDQNDRSAVFPCLSKDRQIYAMHRYNVVAPGAKNCVLQAERFQLKQSFEHFELDSVVTLENTFQPK
jgi:hypothetical protein